MAKRTRTRITGELRKLRKEIDWAVAQMRYELITGRSWRTASRAQIAKYLDFERHVR